VVHNLLYVVGANLVTSVLFGTVVWSAYTMKLT
jgi:hypothetical protein